MVQIQSGKLVLPLTWLLVGITPRLLKCWSVSGSTTSSQVSSPPALMKATTSECFMDSMLTPLTWSATGRMECFGKLGANEDANYPTVLLIFLHSTH